MPATASDGHSEASPLISQSNGNTRLYVSRQNQSIDGKHDEPSEDCSTWQFEAKICARYSRSLVLAYLLQYSLSITSVIAAGHLGTVELGAASIANVTANITGYAVYQGLGECFDVQSLTGRLRGLETRSPIFQQASEVRCLASASTRADQIRSKQPA